MKRQHPNGSYTIHTDGSYSLSTADGHVEHFIRPDHQVEGTFETMQASLVDLEAAIEVQDELAIHSELNRLGRCASWLRSHVEPKPSAQWRILCRPLTRRETTEARRIVDRGTTTPPRGAGTR